MPDKIKKITAAEILDSRGNPTLEVTVELGNGQGAKASVPSGASTGIYEAAELRDGDAGRYGGLGVLRAVENVNTAINIALAGCRIIDQRGIDEAMMELDGSENKSNLGANAMIGVSLAVARAAAMSQGLPLYKYLRTLYAGAPAGYRLPVPLMNVINGGKHSDSNLNFQEFWVIPSGAKSFSESLRQGSEIFHALAAVLKNNGLDTDVGNEGGYAPHFSNHRQVFDLILQAVEAARLKPASDVFLGMDAGSSVFYDADSKLYKLSLDGSDYRSLEFVDYYLDLLGRYPLAAIEDPLAEEDWQAWEQLSKVTAKRYPKAVIIGDDLFVTNTKRLQQGITRRVGNGIIIKPNQVGTLTETLTCVALAQENGYKVAVSHRSGETNDSFIADLAVAVNADFIKTGAPSRGERVAKYNRLLAIERELDV